MTELSLHIAYLLRHQPCVVLPGIGAFVASESAAHIVADTHEFIPPQRLISFNSAITADDGLITWSVSRRQGIPFEQAKPIVAEMISELSETLRTEGAVEIPTVGTLRRRRGGQLLFVPEEAAAMLPTLSLTPLHSRQSLPKIAVSHQTEPHEVTVVRIPFGRRIAAAAASVAILLGLGLTLSTPISHSDAQLASLAADVFTPQHPEAQEIIDPIPVPSGLQLYMAIPQDQPLSIKADTPASAADTYVMVVASLPSRAQAEKFIAEKDDSRLQILEKDSRFRVYITSGSTQSEVTERAAQISGLTAEYPGAWVCRK